MKTRGLPQRRFTGPLKPAPLSLGHLTSQPHLPPQGCAGTGGNGSGLACPQRAHSLRRHLKVRAARDECLRVTVTDAPAPASPARARRIHLISAPQTLTGMPLGARSLGGEKRQKISLCPALSLHFCFGHPIGDGSLGCPLIPLLGVTAQMPENKVRRLSKLLLVQWHLCVN